MENIKDDPECELCGNSLENNAFLGDEMLGVCEECAEEGIVKWFEEVCWICNKIKTVHVDERTTLEDPGFICSKCEEYRDRLI